MICNWWQFQSFQMLLYSWNIFQRSRLRLANKMVGQTDSSLPIHYLYFHVDAFTQSLMLFTKTGWPPSSLFRPVIVACLCTQSAHSVPMGTQGDRRHTSKISRKTKSSAVQSQHCTYYFDLIQKHPQPPWKPLPKPNPASIKNVNKNKHLNIEMYRNSLN